MSDLWQQTTGYGATAPRKGYLTAEQNCRLERIRVARMLWRTHHRQCFLAEGRTQFNFPEMRVQARTITPYIPLNVVRLVTTTLTDLLLGEAPLLKVDDELGQTAIDGLQQRSDLHRVFYDSAKTASWAGEALVEIVRYDGEVYIQDVRPDDVFPLGDRLPDGQYEKFVRYAVAVSQEQTPRRLLLETTYAPGMIARACYLLADGDARGDAVDLALWPVKRPDGSNLLPQETTGIAWNTMVWMANELDEGRPTCDYDGLIYLQDELNAKQTQIARVIAKHADPKLALPQAMANPDGNLWSTHDAFFFRSKDDVPAYITWNAELASAIADRDFTLSSLCMVAELSPGLLGLERGAAPDSARKLRLQATKSLARTKRKATFVRPFIATALATALQMDTAGRTVKVALGGNGGGASVELRDGLPVDDLDQAQTISMLTAGRATMSVERAVGMQIPDPDAAAEEVARLEEEAAAAAPSVNVAVNPPEGGTPNPPEGGTTSAADARVTEAA